MKFGLNGNPSGYIIHGRQRGLSWMVWEVLDEWKMPYPERPYGPGLRVEVDRYRVRVGGPLPGRSREYGNFVMLVRRYSDAPRSWWISPDPGPGRSHREISACPDRLSFLLLSPAAARGLVRAGDQAGHRRLALP